MKQLIINFLLRHGYLSHYDNYTGPVCTDDEITY